MIVVADSSPLITLAQSQHFDLLHDFYVEVIISREVHYEVCVAGTALGGALEVQRATWIRVQPTPPVSSPEVQAVGAGLGLGERSIIYLALTLGADLVLIDDRRARSAAKTVGLKVAGSVAVLERGARLGRIDDLRSVYLSLLEQGIRYDRRLLNQSLTRLGLAALDA